MKFTSAHTASTFRSVGSEVALYLPRPAWQEQDLEYFSRNRLELETAVG